MSSAIKTEQGVSRQSNKGSQQSKWAPAQNAIKYILCHLRKVSGKKDDDSNDDEGELEDCQNELSHPAELEERKEGTKLLGKRMEQRSWSATEGDGFALAGLDTSKVRNNIKKISNDH